MALTEYVIMPGKDYQATCDAVRAKTGKTELLKSGDLANEIGNIAGDPVLQEKTVTQNGEVTADEGYDGLSKVTVDVVKGSNTEELENRIDELEAKVEEDAFAVSVFEQRKASANMDYMFDGCSSLTTVPLFDTSNAVSMSYMFDGCSSLTTVPLFDTSKVTNAGIMFRGCSSLTTIPLFDMRNARYIAYMFSDCTSLTTVPELDVRNATDMSGMFYNCPALTECWLRNIKTNLQVSNGTTWGHLLTVESLIHLIKELRDTGTLKTLTMGIVNLNKLDNTYVKLVDITDEMRAEDDLIDEKLPCELCESTDEGAMLITDYVAEKNWTLA